jgi:L-arabinose transport system substrate-binding protein
MWLNSANHGALAMKILLASIKDGTALPVQSFTDPEYITAANFASDYKAKLCP